MAPSDAKSCEATIPIPLAPPVINATLFSSRPMPVAPPSDPFPDAGEDSPFSRLERMPELPEEIKARPKRKPGQEPTASLTLEAYNRLKAELEELVTTGRERMSERLKVAREHGDIRENAEYDAAKDAQGLMESQIRRLKEALRDPEIIEAPSRRTRSSRTCS